MLKFNSKQWMLVVASFFVALILNFLLWLVIMGKPGDISGLYHLLNTLCLTAVFIVIGDKLLKTHIYK